MTIGGKYVATKIKSFQHSEEKRTANYRAEWREGRRRWSLVKRERRKV